MLLLLGKTGLSVVVVGGGGSVGGGGAFRAGRPAFKPYHQGELLPRLYTEVFREAMGLGYNYNTRVWTVDNRPLKRIYTPSKTYTIQDLY
jgi:hypothetical protein